MNSNNTIFNLGDKEEMSLEEFFDRIPEYDDDVHCRTWNMARKLKIMENEKHPLDDLKNDEITKKREK